MRQIINSKWKKTVALLLVAVLFLTVSSQYFATGEVNASAEVTSYTVTTNGEADWVLTNGTASNGPITLSYKVESASAASASVNGVIATTTPTATYPYAENGSMRFHNTVNYLMVEGQTYTITIGVGDDNKVTFSGSYTEANGTTTQFDIRSDYGHLPHSAGPGVANCQYFGLYIAAATTAKLTNVTCVDAEGNDLGLQSNQSSCTITENEEEQPGDEPGDEPSGTSYTVTTNGEVDWVLTNGSATTGPITLSYKVESATAASANVNGVIATTTPTAQYPYAENGSMRFHNTVNHLMVEGRTYTITIGVGSDNKVTFSGSYTEADGTTTEFDTSANGHLLHPAGPGAANSQYFGLYIAAATTAKLTNVTCVDAQGNDLGLQSNQSSCTITENVEEQPGEEPGDEPSGTSYTVTTNGEDDWALTNGTASNGPITLSYTVESATAADASVNGVIATTAPKEKYPYDQYGSIQFHNTVNQLMEEGRTYTITIGVGADNKVTYSGSYTEADGTPTEFNGQLPHSAGPGAANCQYFGLYIAVPTTARLTNVTCVDAQGNDLGLQSNQSSCVITKTGEEQPGDEPDDEEDISIPIGSDENADKYTVLLAGDQNYFLSNHIATAQSVTLRYTVQSAKIKDGDSLVNGVVATSTPTATYPYDQNGSLRFHNTVNQLMVEGCSYIINMQLSNNNQVIFSGSCVTEEGTEILLDTALVTGTLPHAAGPGNEESQYYGIYMAAGTTATLVNVSCVDADGNDLGLQLNNANSVIKKGTIDDSDKNREKLPSDYKQITLGNFGIKDGSYKNVFVEGQYALSMHKTIFTVDVEFSSDGLEDLRYGGKINGWYGLRFWREGSSLCMEDVEGNTERYTFISLLAGTTLVDEQFNLKISTEYVDSDDDGVKDDVKLGIWFNDRLYENKYIYLKDYQNILGKYMCVYSWSEVSGFEVKGVKGINTGVDYSIVGFTKNWRTELGLDS